MGASLFSIGLTGLNAAQAGLSTTSHNISNAKTAGYSRQGIEQSTNPAMFTGAGFFGEGTKVDTVKRAYNNFLTNQVLAAETKFNEYDSFATEISQIDNMLADPGVGLTPAIADFFGGVQEVAANPASIPARQSMLSTAESFVGRLHNLSERLDEIRAGVEGQIKETVSAISTYAANIAELNNKITIAQQAGSSQPANDLLDSRDQLVKELNQLVRVSTSTDVGGTMSVFIGSGQPLVVGNHPTRLEAQPSSADPSRLAVNILTQSGAAIAVPESLLGGGKLGGLLGMRATALDSTQNQLGLIAVGLSASFNAQHQLGQDLNGNLGADFFTIPSVGVQRYSNATTTAPDVKFGDVSKLVGEDYRLTFTDTLGGYTLSRVSDGRSVSAADVGLSITPAATSWVGDSFLIQPTRHAASSLDVQITDTRMIAAAAPLAARAGSTGLLSTVANSEKITISAPVVASNDKYAALTAANTLLSSSDGANLNITGLPSGMLVSYTQPDGTQSAPAAVGSVPYTTGMDVSFWHKDSSGTAVRDVSFTLSGTPLKPGESFLLGGGSANRGTASVSAPVVASTATADNLKSLQSGLTSFSYSGGVLGVTNLPPGLEVRYTPLNDSQKTPPPLTYSSGMTVTIGHKDPAPPNDFLPDVSFTLSGAPQDGDRFIIGANTSGVSDSRNAVSLGNLQTTKLMLSADGQPSATFQSVYSQLVSSVGNKSREVQVNRDAQESLVSQAYAAQQSVAGVNLDEEAANLIRYQQAYQASSKVMTIASKLFDEVLALGR